MILEPVIRVMCDECGEEEEFPLSATARGNYSDSGLNSYLRRWGWEIVNDNTHYCASCVEAKEEEAKREEDDEAEYGDGEDDDA